MTAPTRPHPLRLRTVVHLALIWLALSLLPARAEMSETARSQIAALMAEKEARTPAQRKMDSQLIYFARKVKTGVAHPAVPNLSLRVEADAANLVLVDVRATVSQALRDFITRSGGEIVNEVPGLNAMRLRMPAGEIEGLAGRSDVRFVEPAAEASTNVGTYLSQAVRTHRVDTARATYGGDGTGLKIGVLSDGVNSLAAAKASGNLNANATFLAGQAGSGDEGTAMMELIQDTLPGATLIFATAFNGTASMASNIQALAAAGCSIIVDDVNYFNESPFQDQVIAQAVTTVSNAGVMYFSCARNSGSKDAGTSGTWEGDFVDGGAAASPITTTGSLHDFGSATTFNTVTGGSSPRADLFWSDPVGASTNDYDLFVLNSTGTTVNRMSTNTQSGTQDPYESVSTLAVNERLVIVKKTTAAARFLHLDTGRMTIAVNTAGCVRGHNCSGAANAFSVAATSVLNSPSPNFFVGGATNPAETFSSDGPRRMFYQPNGTPFTAGNFSSTGGLVLDKPEITAADGARTSVGGFYNFFGTSAAAPDAAAIAGLLKSYNPSLTPAQIRTLMTSTALDIGTAGFDRTTGFGITMALAAIQAAPAPDALNVGSSGLDAVAPVGGPFTSTTGTYTLTNNGASPLNWTAASTQAWNTVTPASGTLAAGATVTVTAAIKTNNAAALAAGNYLDTVTFTNTTSGFSRNFTLSLAIFTPAGSPRPVTVLPSDGTTSGNGRAPIATFNYIRSVYLITAAELAENGLTPGVPITGIGWRYTTAPGVTASAPLVIYLQNTSDTTNTKSTTWSSAIGGMTTVHNASTTLPNQTTAFDVTFSGGSAFNYTGGGLYVAFDWGQYTGTLSSTCVVACNTDLASGIKTGQVQGTVVPTTIAASNFRPETRLTFPYRNAPMVTTPASTSITSSGATLGGNLTTDWGQTITARGVVYAKTSDNPTPKIGGSNVTVVNDAATSLGVFTDSVSGLTASTAYSFAAFATNSLGSTYTSPVSTFTTLASGPQVLSLTRANPTPTNAAAVNWTLTFNVPVTGLAPLNFTLGGSASGGSAVGSPSTSDGGLTWNVPVATDPAGGTLFLTLNNTIGLSPTPSNTPFTGETYTIDKTPPAPTVTPSGTITNSAPITFTIAFTESVSGFNANGLTVTNGTKGTFSGSGSSYTIQVTPSGQGAVTCQAIAAAAQDAAGNASVASNTASVTFDSVAPTVTVATTSASSTNVSPIPVTINFSESVTGFVVGDLTVTNATLSNFSGSGSSYSVSLTPSGQGAVTCKVLAGAAQDSATNANADSNVLSVTFDSVAPTISSVTSTTTNGSYKAGALIPISVNFNEAVNVTGTPTLTLNSGGLASYASGSGSSTLVFNYTVGAGQNSSDLDYSSTSALALSGGTIRDAATNNATLTLAAPGAANSLGANKALVIDTVAPTLNVTTTSNSVTNDSPITFNFTFSESVTGFTSADIAATNGTLSNFTGTGSSYSVSLTPSAQGAVTCRVLAGAAQDLAGNANPDSNTVSLTFDSAPPTITGVTSATANGPYKAGVLIPIQVAFSEVVNVSGTPTLALNSGGTASYVSGSGSNVLVFNYTVGAGQNSGDLDYASVNALSLAGGTIRDTATNNATLTLPTPGAANSLGANKALVIDTVAPGVTVSPTGALTKDTPIFFNFTFTENVSGLTLAGFTVTNGTKGNLTGSGKDYALSVTPLGQGDVTCQVVAAAAQDAAGNTSTLSNTGSVTYDTVPPTVLGVTSTLANGAYKAGTVIPIVVNFSETVLVSGVPTLTLNTGAVASYAGGSGTAALTFNYTVAAGQNVAALDYASTTALALSVAGTLTDQVGNDAMLTLAAPGAAGSLAAVKAIEIDTIRPSSSVTPDAIITNADPITFTITFTEPVTGFTAAGVAVTNGTKGQLSGSAKTYTIPITPLAQGTVSCAVGSTAAQDAAGNPSLSGPNASVTFDSIAPTLIAVTAASNNPLPTRAKVGNVITITFATSEPTTTPVVVMAGRTATVNGNGTTWNATTAVQANDPEGDVAFNIGFSDIAGNAGTPVTATTDQTVVTIDRTPPALSAVGIASSNANPAFAKLNDSIVLTFTANEAIQAPVVSIAGQAAVVANVSENTWTGTTTAGAGSVQGGAAFSISYSDITGNAGTAVSATTNGSGVTIDTATLTPTLTAPATNLLTKSPIGIHLSLPEAALAGSVKLSFSSGANPIDLTLAGDAAAVNGQPFSFDPAAPLNTSAIASGSAIADGVYTVTLSYQDALGNPAATAASQSVTIDTTPPALDLTPQRFSAMASGFATVPSLAGLASDLRGVATLTQDPAVGASLGLGTHLISITATDNAGNQATGQLTVTVAFDRAAPPVAITPHGATGQLAPAGPPSGTTISSFGTPAISDYRDLAALVSMKNGRARLTGVYLEDALGTAQLVAYKEMPAPTPAGATFLSFKDPVLAPGGAIAFLAKVKGGGATAADDEGVWSDVFNTGLQQILREDDDLPGLPGVKVKSVTSISLADDAVLALVKLRPAPSLVAAGKSDTALLRLTGINAGTVLLRTGDPLAGSTIKQISVLQPAPGSNGQGRWHAASASVAKITLASGPSQIVSLPSAAAKVSLLTTGATWSALGLPDVDAGGGRVVMLGTLTRGSSVTATNDTALALSENGAAFAVFSQENEAAPVGPDPVGPVYSSFLAPLVNDGGVILYQATLKGTGVTASSKTGLWWGSPSQPALLARAGRSAPGPDGLPLDGPLWKSFSSVALPNGEKAGPLVLATVAGRNVPRGTNTGLWGVDSTGLLRLLLRTGTSYPAGSANKKLASFRILNALPGSFGTARSYNQTGSVAVLAIFDDKSQTLLRLDLP